MFRLVTWFRDPVILPSRHTVGQGHRPGLSTAEVRSIARLCSGASSYLDTCELMTAFYGQLLVGQSRSGALRDAQLRIKAKYPHPYYWGAFICEGNPSPLPSAP